MILYTIWQWLRQNINQTLYSQKTPHTLIALTGQLRSVYCEDLEAHKTPHTSQKTSHTSPSRASYGVSIVRIWKQMDHSTVDALCIFTGG